MKKEAPTIIHKLHLDISVPDRKTATTVQEEGGRFLTNVILPKLDRLLQEIIKDHKTYRVNKLTVTLAVNGNNLWHWDEALVAAVAEAIRESINDNEKPETETIVSGNKVEGLTVTGPNGRTTPAFLFFLQHGSLPWWVNQQESLLAEDTLISAISGEEELFATNLVSVLQLHPGAMERLHKQFSPLLLTYLFSLLVPYPLFTRVIALRDDWLRQMAGEKVVFFSRSFWHLAYTLFLERNGFSANAPETYLQQLSDAVSRQLAIEKQHNSTATLGDKSGKKERLPARQQKAEITRIPGTTNSSSDQRERAKEQQPFSADEMFVQNAGLVLLHPFLQHFFQEFDLLQEGQFTSDRTKTTAVHLLHYLATGREEAFENELLLEKYLCGYTAEEPIDRFVPLDASMKQESAALLQAVIRHWTALKATSAQGLQEAFLQRNGKLVMGKPYHRLLVEHQTADVLLDRLPWTLGTIKLPWLPLLLFVEWQP